MGECVSLFNYTRHERIDGRLPFRKPAEWRFHVAGCAICTWYMLHHRTDDVRFLGEWQDEREYWRLVELFDDVTEAVIATMIEEGSLADCGKGWEDKEDPNLCSRDIRPRKSAFWPPAGDWPD
ncbi:MAG: hypothetical protein ACF8R7_04835 [Phycisphaerales bacterium JB039]